MRTLRKANSILNIAPREVAADAVGLCVLVLILFAGFMIPAVF